PLDARAMLALPDGGVAEVRRNRERAERLQAVEWILQRPERVAGVEIGENVVVAGSIEEAHQLARVHVARVVLDRDLDTRVQRSRAARATHLRGLLHVPLDATVRQSILPGAEHHPDQWRAHVLCHANPQREMFLRRAPLWFERLRGGTDTPRAGLDLHTLRGRA